MRIAKKAPFFAISQCIIIYSFYLYPLTYKVTKADECCTFEILCINAAFIFYNILIFLVCFFANDTYQIRHHCPMMNASNSLFVVTLLAQSWNKYGFGLLYLTERYHWFISFIKYTTLCSFTTFLIWAGFIILLIKKAVPVIKI